LRFHDYIQLHSLDDFLWTSDQPETYTSNW